MLSLVGLGLGTTKDVTLRGVDVIRSADEVYLETYTSSMQATVEDLEHTLGKKITPVDRDFVEFNLGKLVDTARDAHIVLLVIGSPMAATTHFEFILEAEKQGVAWQVVENASVLTAVGITGLSLYKFGRVTTIPFENKEIRTPYEAYLANKKAGLHTLFLLDITPEKMMTVREGLDYLLRLGLPKKTIVVGCAALGSEEQRVRVGTAEALTLEGFPQCFILHGELNFKEEEALKMWQ